MSFLIKNIELRKQLSILTLSIYSYLHVAYLTERWLILDGSQSNSLTRYEQDWKDFQSSRLRIVFAQFHSNLKLQQYFCKTLEGSELHKYQQDLINYLNSEFPLSRTRVIGGGRGSTFELCQILPSSITTVQIWLPI